MVIFQLDTRLEPQSTSLKWMEIVQQPCPMYRFGSSSNWNVAIYKCTLQ